MRKRTGYHKGYPDKELFLNRLETQSLMRCSRYKEINSPRARYCYKCDMPLSTYAVEMEDQVCELIDRVLEERTGE